MIKKFFDLQEWHDNMELITNKNFFSENYIIDVFLFITAIILYWLQFWQYIYYVNTRNSEH